MSTTADEACSRCGTQANPLIWVRDDSAWLRYAKLCPPCAGQPRCGTCRHWEKFPYEGIPNSGKCRQLEMNLEIQLNDGYVEQIEVDEGFGCVLHEEKE